VAITIRAIVALSFPKRYPHNHRAITDSKTFPGDAGNGLLSRRELLQASGATSALLLTAAAVARPESTQLPGTGMSGYGQPSQFEAAVVRKAIRSAPGTTGSGSSRTPLESLQGTITPNGLFFERHHSGVPTIHPDEHSLTIHGLVDKSLQFTMNALHRYPMISRNYFLECSGNSGALIAQTPTTQSCSEIHGLVSASEWTGIPLSLLLEEAGVNPQQAKWVIAEGSDAAMLARSVPIEKALDDALLVLYQNGEKLRPENGYPLRLLLPGWEGNMSVKWLRRLEVTSQPAMTREETSKYTDLQSDGSAAMFSFPMAVKSVITSPSGGQRLTERGVYQLSGLAWSGSGAISRVEVSADGGRSWSEAILDTPVQDKHLCRFRLAMNWQGQPATLLSRAIDRNGAVQPNRHNNMAGRAPGNFYHVNAIQAWRIDTDGSISNVYV
jgi:sulfane dehydrogenase subunit SoxC